MTAVLDEPKVQAREIDTGPQFKLPEQYELVLGEIREVGPMSIYAKEVAGVLNERMTKFLAQESQGRSRVEMACRIPLPEDASRIRIPDLSFFSRERWPQNRPVPFFGNPIDIVPDLAVEVISPNDEWEDVTAKALEYVRGGVKLVWVISPRLKQVYAYNANPSPRVYTESDTLDGGDVLPGFAVPVSSLFPPVEMNVPAS